MLLTEYSVKAFLDELASKSPAPGGGSASALSGAIGASLVSMVASLTASKEKFRDREPMLREMLQQSERIRESLLAFVDRDAEAFNKVAEVFKMPRETEEQKRARNEAMERALKEATEVPLGVMGEAVRALELCDKAFGNVVPTAISDIGVGALCLRTALYGAWLNVRINLNSIRDRAFVEDIEKKAADLLQRGAALAESVLERARQELGA